MSKKEVENIKDFFAGLTILVKIAFVIIILPIAILIILKLFLFIVLYILVASFLLMTYRVLRKIGSVAREKDKGEKLKGLSWGNKKKGG